ncbi:ATP-binding protein [Chitinimonas taiwanensis]|uniref:Signal transduction histidine-protein kinase/phosphatase MprB n=1 Tax=Chitinimonas taiwanensis DSM 18899 TaxID=1121279 RepID=A0A1K2HQJ8_9NEIS|nr:ATP-binding protein [Chitinimonas taiwanensis]SFZ79055.1 two-component system, NtrC family, sensor histidine kinase GlrK [Chitinimonas taiwanensis DSM 18899]
MLARISFRPLLLCAFLLIIVLLGSASLRGLLTLEKLIGQNRAGASQALELNTDAQLLAERSVAMQRAARQYLVLEESSFRLRYEEARRDAEAARQRLLRALPQSQALQGWTQPLQTVSTQLAATGMSVESREPLLAQAFRDLDALNTQIGEQVRSEIDARHRALLDELEAGRAQLSWQVLAACLLAVALALVFGLWLTKPILRLEAAIVALGENQLDEAIDIHGPADLQRLGQRLDWLRQRLGELEADKARFLSHISHELKTPLAALREGVALLVDEVVGPMNEQQQQIAHILSQNTLALQTQIEDLLRFNAATFEARQLNLVPTELLGLIRKVIATQQLQWQAKQLRVDLQGEALSVAVDADKLSTALGNLLSNAIRFSPDGGQVRFRLKRRLGHLAIEISDQGPGIAPQDRARVFEPFFQGQRQMPGARRGSGIGLSIVHEYIAAHGGQIALLPAEVGCRFRIELPYDPE